MLVDLDRKDIISLLKGTQPTYEVMVKIPEDLGHYVGGFADKWVWNYISESCKYTTEYLYELYLMCKDSKSVSAKTYQVATGWEHIDTTKDGPNQLDKATEAVDGAQIESVLNNELTQSINKLILDNLYK